MHFTGILLSLLWAMALMFVLLKWLQKQETSAISRRWIGLFFFIKLLACFALQALYTYYYTDRSTADIYRFFDDGLILRDIAASSPSDFFKIMVGIYPEEAFKSQYFEQMNAWIKPHEAGFYNDNRTLIRYNALLSFISFGHYEVHAVVTTFLSFLGLLSISRAFNRKQMVPLMAIFTILPGILIWTSGVLKESFVVLGIGLVLWALFRPSQILWKRLLSLGSGTFVLILIKPYFLAAFIPAAAVWWTMGFLTPARKSALLLQWGIWLALLFAGLFAGQVIGIDLVEQISQKQNDFLNHAAVIEAGSIVDIDRLDGSLSDLLLTIPKAMQNVLIEPLPWQIKSAPSLILMLENALYLLLVILILRFRRKSDLMDTNLSFLLQFAFPVLLLIGLTTPVLGAIMRYRAPAMILIILFLFQYLPNHRYPFSKHETNT